MTHQRIPFHRFQEEKEQKPPLSWLLPSPWKICSSGSHLLMEKVLMKGDTKFSGPRKKSQYSRRIFRFS